jgi:hypothetical protein
LQVLSKERATRTASAFERESNQNCKCFRKREQPELQVLSKERATRTAKAFEERARGVRPVRV